MRVGLVDRAVRCEVYHQEEGLGGLLVCVCGGWVGGCIVWWV